MVTAPSVKKGGPARRRRVLSARLEVFELLICPLLRAQDRRALSGEALTQPGQRPGPGAAVEQRRTDANLQVGQGARQGRLRRAQHLRRPRQAALASHDFHGDQVFGSNFISGCHDIQTISA
jgi:hypothetical protein